MPAIRGIGYQASCAAIQSAILAWRADRIHRPEQRWRRIGVGFRRAYGKERQFCDGFGCYVGEVEGVFDFENP